MRLIIIQPDDTVIAKSFGSVTYNWVWVSLARIVNVHASWHISCHDVASGFIEHGLRYTGIRGAESFPVSECCIGPRIKAISY